MRELRASSSVGWDHGGLQAGRVSVDVHLVVGSAVEAAPPVLGYKESSHGRSQRESPGKRQLQSGEGELRYAGESGN